MAANFEEIKSQEIIPGIEKESSVENEDSKKIKEKIGGLTAETINEGKHIFSDIPDATPEESVGFSKIQKEITGLESDSKTAVDYLSNPNRPDNRNLWWQQIKRDGRKALHLVTLAAALFAATEQPVAASSRNEGTAKEMQDNKKEQGLKMENQKTFKDIFSKIKSCSLLPKHDEPGVMEYYQGEISLDRFNPKGEKMSTVQAEAYMDDMNLNTLELFDEGEKANYVFSQEMNGFSMKKYSASETPGSKAQEMEKTSFMMTPKEFIDLKNVYVESISDEEAELMLETFKITLDEQSQNPEYYSLTNKKNVSSSAEFSPEVKKFYQDKIDKIVAHVNSPEYLKKLQTEFNISEAEAKEHQRVRSENIKHGDFSRNAREGMSGGIKPGYDQYEVFMSSNKADSADYVAEHEFLGHKAVDAGKGISPKAVSLISQSMHINEDYMKQGEKGLVKKYSAEQASMMTEKARADFNKIEEVYARIVNLHMEMEDLKIVKYGETVTMEHINRLKELDKQVKTSIGTHQLLNIIDVDSLPLLLNEIAANTPDKSDNFENLA